MNAFSLWVGLGATLGLWRLARSVAARQAGVWVNLGLFVLMLALLGARLFYVLAHRVYFVDNPLEAPQVWLGGVSWPGAIAGMWLAIILLVLLSNNPKGQGISLAQMSDRFYPLLPTVAVAAWLGCWQVGCAYGPETPPGAWWGMPVTDETGATSLRWPLQPLAALSLLVFFALLERHTRPLQSPGLLSGLANAGLLLNLLAVSLLRADPAPTWRGLRIDTWMAIAFLVCLLLYAGAHNLALRIRGKPSFSNS